MISRKIITLGPKGTFSNLAASTVAEHSSGEVVYTRTIPEITAKVVENFDTIGVLPIENSVSGIVGQAQDSLLEHDVVIINELSISVSYSFVSRVPLKQVELFFAHPQAFDQTMRFTTNHLPNANVIFAESNIRSGEKFLEMQNQAYGAIVPALVAQTESKYKGLIKAENIQDYSHNTTRFYVIKKRPQAYQFDYSLLKTSLIIELLEDRPSILFELLREFHVYDINLCRLESRPSKDKPWCYLFYLDFFNNHRSEKCLESVALNKHIQFRVLGSYNRINHQPEASSC